MKHSEAIDVLEEQLLQLQQAGIDVSGDKKFFEVGEWELALEGVYVAHKRNPNVLEDRVVKSLIVAFDLNTTGLGV